MGSTEYEVVWPLGKRSVETVHLAKRLGTLEGKTIAELWDWLFNGERIFPFLEQELTKRYPGIKFVTYEVFGSVHSGSETKVIEALPDKFRQNKVDAVICGVGC